MSGFIFCEGVLLVERYLTSGRRPCVGGETFLFRSNFYFGGLARDL